MTLGGLPLTAQPAHAASTINITHVAPAIVTAGDGVLLTASFAFACDPTQVCSSRLERVVWLDASGAEHKIERTVSEGQPGTTYSGGTLLDTWAVTVPGTDVRFPTFSYRFEAEMWSTGIAGGGGGHWVFGRTPGSGNQAVSVKNEIRLRFFYPNDSVAANVPVEIHGNGVGASWSARSDAQGWLRFTIPSTNAWIASLASGARQGSVLVYAFDGAPPAQGATPGSPITVNGNGRLVVMQLNLGQPLLDAGPGLQDKEVRLLPMHDTTYHGEDVGMRESNINRSDCYDTPTAGGYGYRDCLNTYDGGTQLTPVGENMGGGLDTQGSYVYRNNIRTQTTHAVSIGYGNWAEAEGESSAENTREASHDTGWRGPSDRHGFGVLLQYVLREHLRCPFKDYNRTIDWERCTRRAEFHPFDWGGGIQVTTASLFDKWDTACNPATSDCNDYTILLEGDFETTVGSSAGYKWGYTVSTSAYEFLTLHASTKYGKTTTNTTEAKVGFRKAANRTKQYQYVFVPDGARSGRTPTNSPELAYTASSDADLRNYTPEAPNAPCITCAFTPPRL
jgi:hypothetical protein